jgi:hypothetical protein
MASVAAKTEKRLGLSQEIICNGAVGIVADRAVFRNGGMFEDVGSLKLGVAVVADVVYVLSPQVVVL